jgi:hypothetical protein
MRIWTLHPEYLDRQGLVALWREGLLAQKVLRGMTEGYRSHPQLIRFREHPDPVAAIGYYLCIVHDESLERGYDFDRAKIVCEAPAERIEETRGQLLYEWEHLLSKLAVRDTHRHGELKDLQEPRQHPLFDMIDGDVRSWEKRK